MDVTLRGSFTIKASEKIPTKIPLNRGSNVDGYGVVYDAMMDTERTALEANGTTDSAHEKAP